MNKGKVNIAVIGAGYWGKNLVRVFSQLGALDTVCDINVKVQKEVKKAYPHVKCISSYSEVIHDNTINAVVISTPVESHYHLVREALRAGKDVFVEKPLAMTVQDGTELTELARARNKILMVGHLLEYHPGIFKLKELIDKGELGKIQYIYSNRLNLGKIRREENILWSFAPHDISVVLSLLNEMPECVSACGGNYLHQDIADVTVSNFNFKSGIKGHIFVSWLHPYKEQKLIVVGEKKMAVFDDVAKVDKLLLYSHKIGWIDQIPVVKKKSAEKVKISNFEPLLLEAKHFLQCITKRQIPKTDGQSALRVLKVLEACQMSLEKNGESVILHSSVKGVLPKQKFYAHPTSIVDDLCTVGKRTEIWHYSHVMPGAKIGRNCILGQNVFVGSKAEIGNYVKVQNNVSIYDGVRLEDGVFCGPSVTFTNVVNPRSHISRKNEFKETCVKKGATLGANATIICGTSIGEFAFIGAGAVVTKDVPSYALVYGNPGRLKGWMCRCGTKLHFKNSKAQCIACGDRYMMHNNCVKHQGRK
jgi:UDP-2-acetamido-3-amino-2,3-dideoxy-glucuronate N-acetyltransferase